MDTKILYKYINIPSHWGDITEANLDVSPIRYQKIIEGFDRVTSKSVKILTIGQIAPIVNDLIQKRGIGSVFGINFIDYFAWAFKDTDYDIKFNQFMVIYNVGYEKANNPSFSKQLLMGLIQKCTDNGCSVIIQSNLQLPICTRPTIGVIP